MEKSGWILSVVASVELAGLIACGVKLWDANNKLNAAKSSASEIKFKFEQQEKGAQEMYSQLESEYKQLLLDLDKLNKQASQDKAGAQVWHSEYIRESSTLRSKLTDLKFGYAESLLNTKIYMEEINEEYISLGRILVELSYRVEKCMEKGGKGMSGIVEKQLPWLLSGPKIFTNPNEEGAERKLAEQRLSDALVVRQLDKDYGNGSFSFYGRQNPPEYVRNALGALGKAYVDYGDTFKGDCETNDFGPLYELSKCCSELLKSDVHTKLDDDERLLSGIVSDVDVIVKKCRRVKEHEDAFKNNLMYKMEELKK